MNWKDPVYVNFKENEVVRPVTVGVYWIVIALWMLFSMMSVMVPPVSANNNPSVPAGNNYVFQPENFQGYLYNDQNVTKSTFTIANGFWGLDATPVGGWNNMGVFRSLKEYTPNDVPNITAIGSAFIPGQNMNSPYRPYFDGDTNVGFDNYYIGEVTNNAGFGDILTYRWWIIVDAPAPAPICSFTATPTSGASPLSVVFNDTSSGSPNLWQWIVAENSTGYTVTTSTLENWVASISGVGKVFDVYLNAANNGGSCVAFAPNLLSTYGAGWNQTTTIVLNLDVKNSVTGNLIYDSQVGIQNTTSGVWRNSTAPTGLVYFDSTGAAFEYPLSLGQIIQEAACATGYSCANITFHIPYNNYRSYLNLVPDSVVNSTGTFTLVTTVVMQKSGLPIKGASVQLDNGMMKLTNSAGAATFYNITAGGTKATASFIGYQTAEKTFTGIAGQTKMITLELVVEGETPVPTQVSPTPTVPAGAGNGTLTGANIKGASLINQILDLAIDLGTFVVILLFLWFFAKIGKDILGV